MTSVHKHSGSSWEVASGSQKSVIRALKNSQSALRNNDDLTKKILESANILSKKGSLTSHYIPKK